MATQKPTETPMMKQFFAVKAEHPEAVLLFRCGDFYETYGDDALTASKVLGIVLTKRSSATPGAIPMAGFPYHSLETYLPRLVRAGYKVAVCDQLEDPKLTKKIVKRGITELVTPGVAFNEQLLEQKEHNYIAGLTFFKEKCGVAFLDVSTGTFQVAEGSLDYIGTLLSSFAPKELLVPRGYEKGTKERYGDHYYISTLEEWAFVYDSSVEKLKRQLKVDSLKGFAIDSFPLGITSAGALLIYLEQTQHKELTNICSISRIDEGAFVWMDRFTFRNLEIFASTAGKEGTSLVEVMDKCSSPMGARMLRTWLAMPVMDLAELEDRYAVVRHFVDNQDDLMRLQTMIGDIGDLERIISRAAAGKIMPREVMQLRRGLSQTEPIINLCRGKVEALDALVGNMGDCAELLDYLGRTMHPETASQLGKGDVIASGVNEELDELRKIARHGKDYLLEIQQREIERTGITSLKIGFNNVFGYYLEVRNTYKESVPEEWIRKQTLVNAERYITEELKEYEQKILGAEERIYALEVQIYAELVGRIQANIAMIQKNCRILARLDVLSGFADLAVSNNYCRPKMNDSKVIDIKQGRHPVIETMMQAGEEFVPNDIYLDNEKQQIIILTGPNMAGKSALLRQTALIVLMAQVGSFVPASSAEIEVWPVVLMNLHLIAHGGVVAQLGFLSFADELLDVVPVATEDARVVGRRVVALARSGEAGHDGKFAFFGAHAFQAVGTGCQPQAHFEVAQGVLLIEQQDFLHVILLESALPPVGVIDALNHALAVGFLEPAVAGFLVHEAVDPVAVAAEDEHGDSEEEVLHVRGLLEREHGDGVVDHPTADVLVGGGATGVDVHQLGACPVAGEHVEELVLCHHLVGAYHVDNLVGQFVIVTPCDILAARMAGHGLDGDIVAVFVEDVGTVGGVVG